jgi:hypothetical protein
MGVRYWQVHLLHQVDPDAVYAEVIGVVADSQEAAVETCQKLLVDVQIIDVTDGGPVRFIVHQMIGPNTKKFVNGEEVRAAPVGP